MRIDLSLQGFKLRLLQFNLSLIVLSDQSVDLINHGLQVICQITKLVLTVIVNVVVKMPLFDALKIIVEGTDFLFKKACEKLSD